MDTRRRVEALIGSLYIQRMSWDWLCESLTTWGLPAVRALPRPQGAKTSDIRGQSLRWRRIDPFTVESLWASRTTHEAPIERVFR
jgi:hypothetical protein